MIPKGGIMSKEKSPKTPTSNLQRALWIALVLFAIVLIGLWTFEPEIVETERTVAMPEGEVQTQIRIPLKTVQEESAAAQAVTPEEEPATQAKQPAPKVQKVTEDSIIRPAFIADLSALLVHSYQPKGSHPSAEKKSRLLLDAKEINVHYGIEMTGLSWSGDDLAIGRRSVMRYALRPSMINGLYALYKQRFMQTIDADIHTAERTFGSEKRTLTPQERADFYTLTAQRIRATAGVLKSCSKVGSSMSDINVWLQSERDVLRANQNFQTALHNYQVSKEMNAAKSVTESAEKKMKEKGTAYEQAIRSREAHKAALAQMIRKFKWTSSQDDDTNLYIASWVFRRSKDIANPREVTMTIHDLLLDLADTMDNHAAMQQ